MSTHDPRTSTPGGKPRARALGIPFGGQPGPLNAITDVTGIEVGYVTLIEGDGVRTGVTALHPRGPGGTGDPVAAGFHGQNGNGEMTGVSWINESGTFDGPVAITNTHAVGLAHAGIIGTRRELVIAGVPLGEALADDDPMAEFSLAAPGSGSVIALVATDAPLLPHQCQALARRVTSGLARTGTSGSHFSGDLFLAFSTASPGAFKPEDRKKLSRLDFVPWEILDPYYEAVVQATEEAVINALVANEDMTGRDGHRTPALPRDRVTRLLAEAGRLG